MRVLPLLLVTACAAPPFEPECLADGDVHLCSTVAPRSCTEMFVMSGLTVEFTGGALDRYDATVTVDDRTTTFACLGGELGDRAGAQVWSCSPSGFFLDDRGDHVEITVTTDDATYTVDADPCWDVSEPNGRCCGYAYSATVELPL